MEGGGGPKLPDEDQLRPVSWEDSPLWLRALVIFGALFWLGAFVLMFMHPQGW
jgi:hypothetical protein